MLLYCRLNNVIASQCPGKFYCLAQEKKKTQKNCNTSDSRTLRENTFGQSYKTIVTTQLIHIGKTKKIEVGAFLRCTQTTCSHWIPAHFPGSLWHLADLLWFLYILSLPPGGGCTCCSILPCQLQQGDNDTDSIPALSRLILIRQMGKRWEGLDCNLEKCDLGRQNFFFLHV